MSDILHIKDTYYFEVPKFLWKSDRWEIKEFPRHYIRNSPDYQAEFEAKTWLEALSGSELLQGVDVPGDEALLTEYKAWRQEGAHYAKPFEHFLRTAESTEWFRTAAGLDAKGKPIEKEGEENAAFAKFTALKESVAEKVTIEEYLATDPSWRDEVKEEFNADLSGKIMIPQPFGELRNNYQPASGFCISKFMIIQVVVAAIIAFVFIRLANRMASSDRPRGKLWNMLEVVLLYFRDEVARPAIGGKDADKFLPFLWTIFLFVLGCNLFGMLPWMGAPTGAFGVTLALAVITFLVGFISGTKKFGFLGYWKNQVPSMGLHWSMAIVLVPFIFLIEVLGLIIKHVVLGIRLLANMVAGHLVLLAFLGIAFTATATFGNTSILAIVIALVAGTAISVLEIGVAFLQAYIFTFLSALFIGAATHHH